MNDADASNCCAYLMGLPLALLAWDCGCHYFGPPLSTIRGVTQSSWKDLKVYGVALGMAAVHFIICAIFVFFSNKQHNLPPYEAVRKKHLADYLNTNPVHILRKEVLEGVDVVPFRFGMEHLQVPEGSNNQTNGDAEANNNAKADTTPTTTDDADMNKLETASDMASSVDQNDISTWPKTDSPQP